MEHRIGRTAAVALVATGAVAVTGVVLAVWLVWERSGMGAGTASRDQYAQAPSCAILDTETVEEIVPAAELRTAERGPLARGSVGSCVWSSIDSRGDVPPRSLRVEFVVHFSDDANETTGKRDAADRVAQLATADGLTGAVARPELGDDAVLRSRPYGDGSAEVVFRRGNLVTRVSYNGHEDTSGTSLPLDTAREGAIEISERLDARL